MKKSVFTFIFLVFCILLIFGESDEQEEMDFLLFLPNSSTEFVNSGQARVQLDNAAEYIKNKKLLPGQIHVYGYAAEVQNDIDALGLSAERAAFVRTELQRRGVSAALFSEPVGYGSVYFWGGNTSETDRIPNRRVRIVLEGIVLTPAEIKPAETAETVIPEAIAEEAPPVAVLVQIADDDADEARSVFPWIIILILLALLAAILALLLKRKKRPAKQPAVQEKPPVQEPAAEPEPAVIPVAVPAAVETITTAVDLEEEIRYCAYMEYIHRGGQDGISDEDWYKAVLEISAKYESRGYTVALTNGRWIASKTTVKE